MTDDTSGLTRRTALKGLATAAVVGGTGAAALVGSTGAAAAATEDYGSVSLTSDDGTLAHISIYGDSSVEWTGFENPADSVGIRVEARCLGANVGWQDLHETTADLSQESWGGAGESHTGVGTSGEISQDIGLASNNAHDPSTDWAIVQASGYTDPYGLPTNPLPAAGFEVDGDGESESYTIEMRSHYTWYAGQSEEFSKTFTATIPVTVNNRPKSSTATDGDGDSGVVAGTPQSA